jgi:XTP/dITP diphosphohydrolase
MSRRLAPGARLVVATGNPGKLREINALLQPHGVETMSSAALGLPEPEETAADFLGNARIKALAAAQASGHPALADDSGFCVAGLNGAPGVVSARWAGPDKDFLHAMQRVNRELIANEPATPADRRAWFICVLSLAWPDGHTDSYLGRVDGQAIWPPRGSLGFGYDPIFIPQGQSRTYGEMGWVEKEQDSHRARAFRQFECAILKT